MPRRAELTRKQARFAREYVKDLNGTQAAIRAGYAPASAGGTARDLLRKPHVAEEVRRLEAELLASEGVTPEAVIGQLRRIAFFDVATIYENRPVFEARPCKCANGPNSRSARSLGKGSIAHGLEPAADDPLTGTDELAASSCRTCGRWTTARVLKHPADWPADARAAFSSMDTVIRNLTTGDGLVDTVVKVRLEPKLQALEMLAKHLGLLTERQHVDQTVTITWLPPEPPPAPQLPPAHDLDGTPHVVSDTTADPGTTRIGWDRGSRPGASPNRTVARSFSESGGNPSSAVIDVAPSSSSGVSRRAQERMFPELKGEG